MSAKNHEALLVQAKVNLTYLENNKTTDYLNFCFTRNIGRLHLRTRLAFKVTSLNDIIRGLTAFIAQKNEDWIFTSSSKVNVSERLAWQQTADSLMEKSFPLKDDTVIGKLAEAYIHGASIDWNKWFNVNTKRIPIPHYKFEPIECWVKAPENLAVKGRGVEEELKLLVSEMTGIEVEELAINEEFFEYGVDSLVLLQVIEKVKADYNLDLKINDFYENILNLDDLIKYIAKHSANSVVQTKEEFPETKNPIVQADAMSLVLEKLDRIESKLLNHGSYIVNNGINKDKENELGEVLYGQSFLKERNELTDLQQVYIDKLRETYNAKTKQSKNFAKENRGHLADWINSIDYRQSLKEFLYPIVSKSGKGGHITDLDGNDYIDIGLGYGVSFFGNNPDFIKNILSHQVNEGFELALQSSKVSSIASKICKLTGVERVCFSNTGTEAVMGAVRLVRAQTKKQKIVIFSGSYHGTFDGILGMSTSGDGSAIPISAGTPSSYVKDLIVLNFGTEQAIEYIAEHAHEIAGVLTEPVQSRKPGVQNISFLKDLRKVTSDHNVVLIFDEIITGFRIGAAGAQKHFGVTADIVTYGKVIGGGMPIGIIGGKKEILNLIDGGPWNYGDDSYPVVNRALYGGTFCKHPLALAAAEAVLDKIEAEGDSLYNKVNALSNDLAKKLNTYFNSNKLPVELVNFGSLFRFEFKGKYQAINNPIEIPLFFYNLINEGVYTWERRICFLSTEHTQKDIDTIVEKVKVVFKRMLAVGFFKEADQLQIKELEPKSELIPLTHSQKRMWILDQMTDRQAAYNLGYAYKLEGEFDLAILEQAFTILTNSHELLRANIWSENFDPYLKIASTSEAVRGFEKIDANDFSQIQIERELQQAIWKPFDLNADSLVRLKVLYKNETFYMALCAHHIVSDGWSMNLLMKDLGKIYQSLKTNKNPDLNLSRLKWKEIELAERNYLVEDGKEAKAFWMDRLKGEVPKLDFPVFKTRPAQQSFVGETLHIPLPDDLAAFVIAFSRKKKTTLFNMLQTIVKVLLYKYTGQKDIILGTSVHGRDGATFETVGNFINSIALRSQIDSDLSFNAFLANEKNNFLSILNFKTIHTIYL